MKPFGVGDWVIVKKTGKQYIITGEYYKGNSATYDIENNKGDKLRVKERDIKYEKPYDQCTHINSVEIHPSVKIGGVSLSRCENECLPGMTVCWEHATRDALVYAVKSYAKEIERLGGKVGV